MHSACSGTWNLVWFSVMFKLNHSQISKIPLYLYTLVYIACDPLPHCPCHEPQPWANMYTIHVIHHVSWYYRHIYYIVQHAHICAWYVIYMKRSCNVSKYIKYMCMTWMLYVYRVSYCTYWVICAIYIACCMHISHDMHKHTYTWYCYVGYILILYRFAKTFMNNVNHNNTTS